MAGGVHGSEVIAALMASLGRWPSCGLKMEALKSLQVTSKLPAQCTVAMPKGSFIRSRHLIE